MKLISTTVFAPGRRAFTLVELLISSSLFLVILVILAGVVGSVTNLSSQATARLDATRLGREVFEIIQRDLGQLVSSRTAFSPKALPDALPAAPPEQARDAALQFCVNPAGLNATLQNPTSLFFLTQSARNRTSGNLTVAGYFVQKSELKRPQLRRVFIEPNDPLYRVYSSPSDWLPASILDTFKGGSTAHLGEDRGWMADGVLGIWVRCLDENGAPILADGTGAKTGTNGYAFDSRRGYQSGVAPDKIVYSTFNALPAFVDVGLVCMAARETDLISTLTPTQAASPDTFEQDIANFVQQFQTDNRRVKTALGLSRRFAVRGSY